MQEAEARLRREREVQRAELERELAILRRGHEAETGPRDYRLAYAAVVDAK